MTGSEFNRMQKKIDVEVQGAESGLYGLAIVARHAMITARMERMSCHITSLMQAGLHEEARAILERDDLWNIELS